MDAPLRRRDHLRAALVALHVVAVVGMALPSPEGLTAAAIAGDPKFSGPVGVWEKGLARVGIPKEVTRGVVLGVGGALEGAEDAAERVFGPYARLAGTKQSWRMFGTSPARASRLEMWLEEDGAWRPLYVPFDEGARWHAELWEDGRARGALRAMSGHRGWWSGLAHSAARRAAREFPDATRFRLQRVPLEIPSPEALARDPRVVAGEPRDVVIVRLADERTAG